MSACGFFCRRQPPVIDNGRKLDSTDQRGLPLYDNPFVPNPPNSTSEDFSDSGAYELQQLPGDTITPQVTVGTPADGVILN